jgi:hypothetical protein
MAWAHQEDRLYEVVIGRPGCSGSPTAGVRWVSADGLEVLASLPHRLTRPRPDAGRSTHQLAWRPSVSGWVR